MSKGLSHEIDKDLLMKHIRESGKSLAYLARKLGISEQGFRNKLDGKSSFYVEEVELLCKELHIVSLGEMAEVFNIVLVV